MGRSINDMVYLRASAMRGFLESYQVIQIRTPADKVTRYTIAQGPKPPLRMATAGDRILYKNGVAWEVTDDDLVDYCEAIDYIITFHTNALEYYQKLKLGCTESSETSG